MLFVCPHRRYNMGAPHGSPRSAVWLENRRTQKWVKMIGKQLEDWEVYVGNKLISLNESC